MRLQGRTPASVGCHNYSGGAARTQTPSEQPIAPAGEADAYAAAASAIRRTPSWMRAGVTCA